MVHSTDEGEGSSVRSKFTTNTFSVMLYSQENAEANAARIVHCVNLHDELVEALQSSLHVLNLVKTTPPDRWSELAIDAEMENLSAVLAKTRGKE